jgi:hypothetical protein
VGPLRPLRPDDRRRAPACPVRAAALGMRASTRRG